MYMVTICDNQGLPKGFKENDIRETGWNEGTSDEEVGSDVICLLVFCIGGF